MAMPTLKKLKEKEWDMSTADDVYSIYIRERDRKCYFCNNPASQNSHFWGRGNKGTRYHDLNCDGICGGCHMKHEGNKHGEYRDRKIEQLGIEGYKELEKLARDITKQRDAIAKCKRDLEPWLKTKVPSLFELSTP